MALKGNLADFKLTEILKFVALGKKIGALVIEHDNVEVSIYFKGGGVYAAENNIEARSVTEKLTAMQTLHADIKMNLLQHPDSRPSDLIEHDALPLDEIYVLIRDEVADVISEVFAWTNAPFHFVAGEELPREDWGVYVDIEDVITLGRERGALWEEIRRHVRSFAAVFAMNEDIARDHEVVIGGDEWRVLCHIDGERSVHELASHVGLSTFETAKVLAQMAERSLIVHVKDATLATPARETSRVAQVNASPDLIVLEGGTKATPTEEETTDTGSSTDTATKEIGGDDTLLDELAALAGGFSVEDATEGSSIPVSEPAHESPVEEHEAAAGTEDDAQPQETPDETTSKEALMTILKGLKKL